MNGSQSGSQDSPGGTKVFILPFMNMQLLTSREDIWKRHIETSYHQATHRGVSYPSL